MLKKIRIKNFKSHKDSILELKPTTIFIGPNNSGKSSIFHILQLIKGSAKSGYPRDLVPPKPLEKIIERGPNKPIRYSYPNLSIDVGKFEDVLRKGASSITVELEGEIPPISLSLKKKGIDNIYINYKMTFRNNLLSSHEGKIQVGPYTLNWEYNHGKRKIDPESLTIEGLTCYFRLRDEIFTPISIGTLSIPPDTSPEVQEEVNNIFSTLDGAPRTFLNSIFTISGIRGFEEWAYHLADVAGDMELVLLEDRALAFTTALASNRVLEDKLSSWLEKFLGIRIWCELRTPGKIVTVKAKRKDKTNPFIGEGLGIQQLLFIFFPIALAQNKTICIEEPEVHLHPEAQAKLVSHLIKIQKEEKKQYLIATHSEHILFAFLNAVAKGDITPEDLAVYYFYKKGDVTKITRSPVDKDGRIPGGLPGFFEHNLKNLIEYLDTLTQKG